MMGLYRIVEPQIGKRLVPESVYNEELLDDLEMLALNNYMGKLIFLFVFELLHL